ncbi:MAG: hypothetical protein AAGA96_16900, partial [Verrucomicrobiota bacterium]
LPGLPMEALPAMLNLMSDLALIDSSIPKAEPLRAIPLPTQNSSSNLPSKSAPTLQAIPAASLPRFATLPSILFARNTYLLQNGQEGLLDETAKLLLEPPLVGRPVRLNAVRFEGGSGAFVDYLCENRLSASLEHLKSRGVNPSLISTTITPSSSRVDAGEVEIVVDLPPEVFLPEDEELTAEESNVSGAGSVNSSQVEPDDQ